MPGNWKYLGEGSFNYAYISRDMREVLKIQKSDVATDAPERSVRLWNAINAHIQPPARLESTEYGSGWVCPFVEGEQAPDAEMAMALIDIFNNTGRIVVDAVANKNFIKTPAGQVLCVDIGMMLQLEKRDTVTASDNIRRKSIVSLDMWETIETKYEPFFEQYKDQYEQTIYMVKALLFIKNERPDMYDVTFLKTNPQMVKEFAQAYDRQYTAARTAANRAAVERANAERANAERANAERTNAERTNAERTNAERTNAERAYAERANAERTNAERANSERANPERANAESVVSIRGARLEPLIAHYTNQLERITELSTQAKADPNLSNSEKIFMARICNQLQHHIKLGISQLRTDSSIKPAEIDNTLEKKINGYLQESKSISRRSGFRGFLNDLCELFHLGRPFTITDSQTKNNIKQIKAKIIGIREEGSAVDNSDESPKPP